MGGSRDADWYRQEAARLRAAAERITSNPMLRATYLDIVREYERLAEQADGSAVRTPVHNCFKNRVSFWNFIRGVQLDGALAGLKHREGD